MTSTLACDEDLLRRLPLPLAQLYRRAQNAHTPLERHQAAYYLWEASLKLLGAVAIIEYLELGDEDPALAELLRKLARPSLGHWWEFVYRLIPVLAEAGDEAFGRLEQWLLGRNRDDLPRAAALDGLLLELADGKPHARTTIRLRLLFDRLVAYRNDAMGHGALGQQSPTLGYVVGKYARRHRAASAGAFVLLLCALVGTMAAFLAINRSRIEAQQSEQTAIGLRNDALEQKSQAEKAKNEAETAKGKIGELLDFNRIALAYAAWRATDLAEATWHLEECAPASRGWEWRYCQRLCHPELVAFRGHEGPGTCLAYSPDGRPIASRLHLLVLAVDKYRSSRSSRQLNYAVSDASAFQAVMELSVYEKGERWTLLDANMTKEGVMKAVDLVRQKLATVDPDDMLIVFYSGHGLAVAEEQDYFFLPCDFPFETPGTPVGLCAISWKAVRHALSELPCRTLFVLDASNSGKVAELELGRERAPGRAGGAFLLASGL